MDGEKSYDGDKWVKRISLGADWSLLAGIDRFFGVGSLSIWAFRVLGNLDVVV